MRVAHADKHLAFQRQRRTGSHLAFGIGNAEIGIEPHHLARRSHLGAENNVLPDELIKRKYRLFHGPIARPNFLCEPKLTELCAGHHLRGELGQWFTDGFADKRNRPRRARVNLQHINNLILHRVLHVHQASDLQLARHRVRVLAHRVDGRLRKFVRRQHHRRIARVHAGKLHMLKHPTDNDRAVLGIRDAVHIHLRGVFQKFIHQHRPFRRCLHRVLHIMAQLGIRIHNLHRATTEHKRRSHQHGIIQLVRGGHCFLLGGG